MRIHNKSGKPMNIVVSGRLVGSGRDLYGVIDSYQTIQNIG